MTVRFKQEVRVVEWTDQIVDVLRECGAWSLRSRVDVEINSIDDGAGVHMPGSLHGLSLAVDVDTVGDKPADLEQLAEWFRRRLPAGYDIVFEGNHIHVEADMHRPALMRKA